MKNVEYWQPELETMPRQQLEALQVEKLRRTIDICLQSPFYKRVLGERGITSDTIKTIDDVRRLPFTTKQDLRENYPFGLVGGNMKDAIRYGNRLIMMMEGRIVYDVRGEEKKNLKVEDLLAKFSLAGEMNDKLLLG